jgi:hypothetical protein
MGDLSTYLQQLTTQFNLDNQGALKNEVASRPTSDGFSDGGRVDLLRRAFVGLGLGQVTDEKGQLVFNFNPDALHLDSFGQLSPRIIVHQSVLYGALDEHIDTLDEGLRTPARDELKKDLGDLDDVEYSLRWTPKRSEPATDLQEVASTLLDQIVPREPSNLTNNVHKAEMDINTLLGGAAIFGANIRMTAVCSNAAAKTRLADLVKQLRSDIPAANEELKKALDSNGFTRLADLVEGNARLVFNGTYRQRSGTAGPDTTSIDVTLQRGWVSYQSAKRWVAGRGLMFNAAALDAYFKANGRLEGAAPLFSLVASYSETDAFLVPLPGVTDPFNQDKVRKVSAKATAAAYFGGGRNRKLELTAMYDDASNDKTLQDRFVANLTWVEKLGESLAQAVGGSEFVATLVWANKPEFRGEVDEDFGLRAGLKWSLGDGKK